MPIRPRPTQGNDLADLEREFANACRLHELRLGRPLDLRDVLFVARELGYRKMPAVTPCPNTGRQPNPTSSQNRPAG